MDIIDLFIEGRQGQFTDYCLFKISGPDREKFFQGQTTNDLVSLGNNSFQLNSRIDRGGKVQFFFLLLKSSEYLYLLIPNSMAEEAVGEFNKFIIMDDVEIIPSEGTVSFIVGADFDANTGFESFLFGVPALISIEPIDSKLDVMTQNEMNRLNIELGWPVWGQDVHVDQLINNTLLNELSVSYTKGCFLGQETVSKVQNGRGATYYPIRLLSESIEGLELGPYEINSRKGGEVLAICEDAVMVNVFREFRIENKQFEISQNGKSFQVEFKNYNTNLSKVQFADYIYHKAVDLFQKNDEAKAIEYLKVVIKLSPDFSDAYEILGVIFGRLGDFQKGIDLMDQLLKVDNTSVMAHTNKSLFLMNLGKIEEAEVEKGHATFKSFAVFGKEAKEKKEIEAQKLEKDSEMEKRESMFKQVLEIDLEDTIANFGMADIYFYKKEYEQAELHLRKVISVDAKYSTAYSLLGKTLEILNKNSEAKEVYKKGISVASARGELMPANEMQARLVKLK
ncbi:hypothetical protein A9Q84_20385 [Halobacteriovorax marinus]|uniref:Uncharacterized protein n=1 Tax=Halobacteriovorax marinus TaxID=97084 RepID=A0A1Y5F7K2_9BACT|nr:hypothetical protein A9Q84_20385 [Halobacteriovorax marinus]